MAKLKTQYRCKNCDYVSASYLGRCPNCGAWNQLEKETEVAKTTSNRLTASRLITAIGNNEPKKLSEIDIKKQIRITTPFSELNRVLGGGIVPGSLVLVGGDPGIGKSTLMLQIMGSISNAHKVLYVSGEESASQIKCVQKGYILVIQNYFYILKLIWKIFANR